MVEIKMVEKVKLEIALAILAIRLLKGQSKI